MRIGLFTDTYAPEINGVVSSVLMLREGLIARGHEVWVFAPGPATLATYQESPDEPGVIRIPSMPLVVLPERRVATPLDVGLLRMIKSLHLDVIHTQTEFGVGSFGFRAAHKFSLPHVHTYHTVWEDYTHYIALKMFDSTAKTAARKLTRMICEKCDRVIAPTRKTYDLLDEYGVEVPIAIVPTGVDLERFSPAGSCGEVRAQWGLDRFERILLSLGRIAPEKSVVHLMEMVIPYLRKHPTYGFLVVGGGPSLERLQEMAEESGVASQVVFTREIPWEHIPEYYRVADVLVGDSETETQGLTFIEALASGVPLVVRYNSCFDGIIENGESGALFRRADEFEPALDALFNDQALYEERQKRGLAAAQAVSKDVFVKKVEEIYRSF